jgi:hypothetical protein
MNGKLTVYVESRAGAPGLRLFRVSDRKFLDPVSLLWTATVPDAFHPLVQISNLTSGAQVPYATLYTGEYEVPQDETYLAILHGPAPAREYMDMVGATFAKAEEYAMIRIPLALGR